jgi:predicted protein tyrosine phosphatase
MDLERPASAKLARSCRVITRLHIGAVVCAASEFPEAASRFASRGVRYLDLMIPDDDETAPALAARFDDVADFVGGALRSGVGVLVHCAAGVSRSAALVIYTVMRLQGWTLRAAVAHVYASRPCVCPNVGLRLQLQAAEARLYGGARTMDDHWAGLVVGGGGGGGARVHAAVERLNPRGPCVVM